MCLFGGVLKGFCEGRAGLLAGEVREESGESLWFVAQQSEAKVAGRAQEAADCARRVVVVHDEGRVGGCAASADAFLAGVQGVVGPLGKPVAGEAQTLDVVGLAVLGAVGRLIAAFTGTDLGGVHFSVAEVSRG